ncbi:MAG: hypothetical protein IJ533_09295 [Prevotella sp.]|nr:hypothetical protein [Prevotella sp.]
MMKYRLLASIVALSMTSAATYAQKQNLFNHMELGITLGSTGYGLDLSMPVTDWARLRTGFSYVPKIEVPMTFGVQVGDDPTTSQSKFDKLSGYLSSFTGNQVKSEVEMIGRPNFWNWNFMVDVFPLKNNRHWHATVGFFLGPKKVAEAYNKTESMASLLAVSIYNNLYDKLYGLGPRELIKVKIIDIPDLEEFGNDPNVLKKLQQGMEYYGRMGVKLGTYSHDIEDDEGNVVHKQGETYLMDPDESSMVSADMKVNAFKPYIGVGYDGHLTKHDDRLTVGFDAGIMLWGGTPHLTTHDGTDLIHDVENIKGKVGDYVSAMESFKAFPLLNFRIAYRLF